MKQVCLAVAAMVLCTGAAQGQVLANGGQSRPNLKENSGLHANAVQYLFPEQVNLPAGRPSPVALHFRIAPGLHINSHAPADSYLVPTVFSIPQSAGVSLNAVTYPAGGQFALPIDPKTKLNVYTGEFVIQVRIVAVPGNHLVQGKLRYQACDTNQCMPPKTITVPIDVIGK
jgi:DsbC/DsbD-like thiol-disulfide interchange protein